MASNDISALKEMIAGKKATSDYQYSQTKLGRQHKISQVPSSTEETSRRILKMIWWKIVTKWPEVVVPLRVEHLPTREGQGARTILDLYSGYSSEELP